MYFVLVKKKPKNTLEPKSGWWVVVLGLPAELSHKFFCTQRDSWRLIKQLAMTKQSQSGERQRLTRRSPTDFTQPPADWHRRNDASNQVMRSWVRAKREQEKWEVTELCDWPPGRLRRATSSQPAPPITANQEVMCQIFTTWVIHQLAGKLIFTSCCSNNLQGNIHMFTVHDLNHVKMKSIVSVKPADIKAAWGADV